MNSHKRQPLTRKLVTPPDALIVIAMSALCALIAWGIAYLMTDSFATGVLAGFPAGVIACVVLFARAPRAG